MKNSKSGIFENCISGKVENWKRRKLEKWKIYINPEVTNLDPEVSNLTKVEKLNHFHPCRLLHPFFGRLLPVPQLFKLDEERRKKKERLKRCNFSSPTALLEPLTMQAPTNLSGSYRVFHLTGPSKKGFKAVISQ